jgi:hypothetical protein
MMYSIVEWKSTRKQKFLKVCVVQRSGKFTVEKPIKTVLYRKRTKSWQNAPKKDIHG